MDDSQEEGLKDFSESCFGELLLPEAHVRSDGEGEEAVSEVSKHDGKQEREGDDGEQSRVDLLVGGDTVRVDNGLERLGEHGRSVERRRRLVRSKLRQDRRDRRPGGLLSGREAKNGESRSSKGEGDDEKR